jgi:long-chain acyl-CoA synthetase
MAATASLDTPLVQALEQHSEREAVVDGDLRLTYAELADRVARLGGGLQGIGVGQGDVVALIGLNGHAHFEFALAIPRIGAVLNDLNFRLAEEELAFIVGDSGARVLLCDDTHLEISQRLKERCDNVEALIHMTDGEAASGTVGYADLVASEPVPAADVGGDTLATISYTGGTTGLPKGVMLSHANLLANARNGINAIGWRTEDRYLHAAPMFHAADASTNFSLTWVGGTHVFIPGFDPVKVASAIEAEKVTVGLLVPTMINMTVNNEQAMAHDLSSLRLMMYGASPMPAELQRKAVSRIPCEWIQLYGMTEAAPLVTMCPAEDHAKGVLGEEPYQSRLRSAGRPIEGVEAEVRRPDGSRADVGEPGEIFVRGENIMLGYWNRPQETASALHEDGWYQSGDMAYEDADGYLYIVDRAKDMIITGGENVYSTEVENALCDHPAVLEVAVFGVPDGDWGEKVHASVVLHEGASASEDELVEHCRGLIAGYKVPRSVELRDEPLPKSGAGKILKRELREPHWEGLERRVS